MSDVNPAEMRTKSDPEARRLFPAFTNVRRHRRPPTEQDDCSSDTRFHFQTFKNTGESFFVFEEY